MPGITPRAFSKLRACFSTKLYPQLHPRSDVGLTAAAVGGRVGAVRGVVRAVRSLSEK